MYLESKSIQGVLFDHISSHHDLCEGFHDKYELMIVTQLRSSLMLEKTYTIASAPMKALNNFSCVALLIFFKLSGRFLDHQQNFKVIRTLFKQYRLVAKNYGFLKIFGTELLTYCWGFSDTGDVKNCQCYFCCLSLAFYKYTIGGKSYKSSFYGTHL